MFINTTLFTNSANSETAPIFIGGSWVFTKRVEIHRNPSARLLKPLNFQRFFAPQLEEHFDGPQKKPTSSFKMTDTNSDQQNHWYSDDKCTTEVTLPANDPYFHMKYDKTYYLKRTTDGEECVMQ